MCHVSTEAMLKVRKYMTILPQKRQFDVPHYGVDGEQLSYESNTEKESWKVSNQEEENPICKALPQKKKKKK